MKIEQCNVINNAKNNLLKSAKSRVSTYLLHDKGSRVTFVRTGETGPFRPSLLRTSEVHKKDKVKIIM